MVLKKNIRLCMYKWTYFQFMRTQHPRTLVESDRKFSHAIESSKPVQWITPAPIFEHPFICP